MIIEDLITFSRSYQTVQRNMSQLEVYTTLLQSLSWETKSEGTKHILLKHLMVAVNLVSNSDNKWSIFLKNIWL